MDYANGAASSASYPPAQPQDPYADAPATVPESKPYPDRKPYNGDSAPNGSGQGAPRGEENGRRDYGRGAPSYDRGAAPRRPPGAPEKPPPSQTIGVFGLSVRTREQDLDIEFGRYGTVESVHIVYDQRSERSRGFGFIRMSTIPEAQACIDKLNGMDLNGRRIRVDFSATQKPHDPTPGAYMGVRRPEYDARPRYDDRRGGGERDRYGGGRDYDRRDDRRDYGRDYERDRERGYYDRDSYYDSHHRSGRDYHERSPPRRRRDDYDDRKYSRSPPRQDRDPRAARPANAYDDVAPAPPAHDAAAPTRY